MAAFLYTILSHPDNLNPADTITFPTGESFLKVTSKTFTDGSKIENCTFGTIEDMIPVQQIAVLELASAYTNTGGLCMYEKFGFTYDQSMFSDTSKGIDCFDDRNNLPMLIDFTTKPGYAELDKNGQKQKIIDILVGKDRGFPKSKICGIRDEKQRLLGLLKTIKLHMDNTPGETFDDFLRGSPEGVIINQVRTMNEDPNAPRGSRTAVKTTREGTIEEVIDYLESHPPQANEPDMETKIARIIKFLPKEKKKGGRTSRKLRRKMSRRYSKKRY